ncbi:glycosyltransferase [Stutzerimonas sp. VN223-3]|uniref:glycosyltransferase n=1 Tax=Stutzerimonas sp. VN223-3 TaxID=3384601 RepID=UPI0038B5B516
MATSEQWVLQFCHGYDGPFLDCARQYAALFEGTSYKVCTVYLTGAPNREVEQGSASHEVVFLNYSSPQVRGLKLKAIRDIRRITASRPFTFCIAHRFKPVYIALLGSKLPVIGVHHAFGDYERLYRRLFAGLYRKRLALLGVSNAVRDDIRNAFPSWPADRIETLYNRVNLDAIRGELITRDAARQFLCLPDNAWVIGNVGRLHPDKDQATLLRGFAKALPELPEGSLLAIMGSGRLEDALRRLANDLGIAKRVRFLGQISSGRRYFPAFDIFVLTSDHEPFGMVLLEAMAAGVPVIGTDCGGGREVVASDERVFKLGDDEELAAVLLRQSAADGLAELRQRMLDDLQLRFSDQAAFRLFWSLPLTRNFH